MTLPRLAALNAYWEQHPPMNLLMEAMVGFRAPRRTSRQRLKELAARFGSPRVEPKR